jgi:hypothetical protein
MIKPLTQIEIDAIQSSWMTDASGVLRWKRKPNGRNIGDIVGISTRPSGHQNVCLSINGKLKGFVLARIVWFLRTGQYPKLEVEHKDCNPNNNSIENLRLSNRSENLCNTRLRADNKTGHKGIYPRYGKWVVQIWKNAKCHNLGIYESIETAITIRNLAIQRFHGEFARTK